MITNNFFRYIYYTKLLYPSIKTVDLTAIFTSPFASARVIQSFKLCVNTGMVMSTDDETRVYSLLTDVDDI